MKGKRAVTRSIWDSYVPILGKKHFSVKTPSKKLEKPTEHDFENSKKGHFRAHFVSCSAILVEIWFLSKIGIRRSGAFILEHISQIVLVFPLLTLNK